MFVLNTNGNDTGYSCISVNGVYDPPLDGSAYSFFPMRPRHTTAMRSTVINCCAIYKYGGGDTCPISCVGVCGQFNGWNGCDQCASTFIPGIPVNDYDRQVYFPSTIGSGGTNSYEFLVITDYQFCACSVCIPDCCFSYEWCVPESLSYSVVSQKKFPAGCCIGKTICGYLGALVEDTPVYNYNGGSTYGYRSIYRTGCVKWFVCFGLLHEDGSTNDLFCCQIESSQGKPCASGTSSMPDPDNCGNNLGVAEMCSGYRCPVMTNPNLNLIYGSISTNGLTTCEGDRLFFRVGAKETCGNICYRMSGNAYCNVGWLRANYKVALYGGTYCKYGWGGMGPCALVNGYDTSCCCCLTLESGGLYCLCTDAYAGQEQKFTGIQFSIE